MQRQHLVVSRQKTIDMDSDNAKLTDLISPNAIGVFAQMHQVPFTQKRSHSINNITQCQNSTSKRN